MMPSAGLSLIEQYRLLAKDLEQQKCGVDLLGLDQEVPQTNARGDSLEQKSMEVKQEQEMQDDIYNSLLIFDSLMAYGSDNSASSVTASNNTNVIDSSIAISSPPNFFGISKDSCNGSSLAFSDVSPQRLPTTCQNSSPFLSSTVVSADSSFSSSCSSSSLDSKLPLSQSTVSSSLSPSPTPVSALNLPTVISSPTVSLPSSQSKVSSFVTELGGSGGTMTFFPSDEVPAEPLDDANTLDIMDLDKQPFSFYDELEPFRFSNVLKPAPAPAPIQNASFEAESYDLATADDSKLDEMMMEMRNDFLAVCESLGIPIDVESWSAEHVKMWISWVCRKYNVADISLHLFPMSGRDLLVHPSLADYGESGKKISDELDFCKAGMSWSPFSTQQCQPDSLMSSRQTPQTMFMDNYFFPQPKYSPSVSPAPSTGSNSQDGSLSGSSSFSTPHSENSEDEMINSFGRVKPEPKFPAARPTGRPGAGRGHHKQTIHLWQFLRELLVSQDDHSDCIRWLDRKAGIFKIEDSKKVAGLWGRRKNRPAMNYDKLSRSVRQYYKKGIIKKTDQSKRLVYQFCDGYL